MDLVVWVTQKLLKKLTSEEYGFLTQHVLSNTKQVEKNNDL